MAASLGAETKLTVYTFRRLGSNNEKAVDPASLPRLTYLSPLETFCEFEVPQSLPREFRDLAYPIGCHQSYKSLFLLYLSQEERGLRVTGYTLGDRLKLPVWHSDKFMCPSVARDKPGAPLCAISRHHVRRSILSKSGDSGLRPTAVDARSNQH